MRPVAPRVPVTESGLTTSPSGENVSVNSPVFVSLFHDFYEGMLFRNIAKILMVFLLYLLILAKYQNKDTRDAV